MAYPYGYQRGASGPYGPRHGYGGGGYGGGGYGGGYGGGGYGGGGFVGVRLRREYDEPRQRGYPSYSNRSGLGGMGNPFSKFSQYPSPLISIDADDITAGMGDRMGGAMRGARRHMNAGLDTVGGWDQAMDDRFDRSNFKRGVGRIGQRVANGFAGLRPGGGGRNRTDWGHTAGGSWRYA